MDDLLLIGIIVVLVSIWISIWYVAVSYLARIIVRFTAVKWVTNKIFVLVMSVIVACLVIFGWVIADPAKNDKTAYIEPHQSGYIITVKGKKLLMVHDPVSWIFRETYDVSDSFLIPRKNGIINGNEIQFLEKNYKFFGTIAIDGDKMKIQLYNKQDQTSTCDWNGKYNLKTR